MVHRPEKDAKCLKRFFRAFPCSNYAAHPIQATAASRMHMQMLAITAMNVS